MKWGLERRAQRALERQLAYQRAKAEAMRGHEAERIALMQAKTAAVRAWLERVRRLPADAKVLEVGSGAHGLIFAWEAAEKVGVDPLADEYRRLFPAWQGWAQTLAASGEALPFEAASFDLVLSDNVVDHATDPRRCVEEMARVLRPGGLLYFTVNVHHPVWHGLASVHAAVGSIGVPLEIGPFADHTVHLTRRAAERLFDGLALRIAERWDDIGPTRRDERLQRPRHAGDRLKRWFFKNAEFGLIAVRD